MACRVFAARGMTVCECGTCDPAHSCEGAYEKETLKQPLFEFGFVFALVVALSVVAAVLVVEVRYLSGMGMGSGYVKLVN